MGVVERTLLEPDPSLPPLQVVAKMDDFGAYNLHVTLSGIRPLYAAQLLVQALDGVLEEVETVFQDLGLQEAVKRVRVWFSGGDRALVVLDQVIEELRRDASPDCAENHCGVCGKHIPADARLCEGCRASF